MAIPPLKRSDKAVDRFDLYSTHVLADIARIRDKLVADIGDTQIPDWADVGSMAEVYDKLQEIKRFINVKE